MVRVVLKSKIDTDGILRLSVPVGPEEAGSEVRIVIESEPAATPQEYLDFLKQTAGARQGEFERPEQGALENRAF